MEILFESSVRATLMAAAVGLVLMGLRIRSAAVRHAVWVVVMVVMLLLPAIASWGPRTPLSLLPPATPVTVSPTVASDARIADAVSAAKALADVPERSIARQPLTATIYLVGLFGFLLRLCLGTVYSRRLVARAVVADGRLSAASCTTPITVGWLRPTIILPPEWTQWPDAQLRAILAHEGEHVRRRDPLWQWFALLNRAVFWFHPLAWWLERRVSRLAEESCDAAVLSSGHDPYAYAEYLLNFARHVTRAGSRVHAVGVSMPGAGLSHRIRRILAGVDVERISVPRMASLVAICAVAIAILTIGVPARAQQPGTPSSAVAFDVASIKINRSRDSSSATRLLPGGAFSATNATLRDMIIDAFMVPEARLEGGPDWINRERYDVIARPAQPVPGTDDPASAQTISAYEPVLRMLRTLLAERFKLVVHRETREVNAYRLIVLKNGPNLKPNRAEVCEPPSCGGTNSSTSGRLTSRRVPITRFATNLSNITGRPVVDATGLTEFYDIDLDWAPDPSQFGGKGRETPDDSRPSLFTALEEQLGLKLEPSKTAIEILVVDAAERPSEN